tara:strand:- start:392 stop:580 length:189 start_codon:yes stop_codon:yes gene_type:complete
MTNKKCVICHKKTEFYINKKCVICHKKIMGWGNNAEPITKGICCDKCNYEIIIPTRLKNITG